jgi:type IV pilus modification protein PilV
MTDMDNQQCMGQQGFTLIEVMMAMVILGIGILAIVGLHARNMTYNNSSKKQTEGYTWAMDRIENILNYSYDDSNLNIQGSPTVVGDGHVTSQGPYTVEWDVLDNAGNIANSKRIHVSVRWRNKEVAQLDYTRVKTSF